MCRSRVFLHGLDQSHRATRPLSSQLVALSEAQSTLPFDAQAANLFFQLVSSRYERASVIVTSNKPFGRWGEVFGDAVVAAAMIDRLVHHAEVVSMKGDSYRGHTSYLKCSAWRGSMTVCLLESRRALDAGKGKKSFNSLDCVRSSH